MSDAGSWITLLSLCVCRAEFDQDTEDGGALDACGKRRLSRVQPAASVRHLLPWRFLCFSDRSHASQRREPGGCGWPRPRYEAPPFLRLDLL